MDEFMKRRYEFRFNLLTSQVECRQRNSFDFYFRPVNKRLMASITMNAQYEGLKLWDKDVVRYLNGGVFAADRSGERVHLPVLPAEMVNTTGCGDAFMAAITWAYLAGTDLTGTAKAGLAASAIAMEGAETINPAMSAEALKLRAGL